MPFKSKKQRRYLHSQKPELAAEWEEKYPPKKPLPEKAKRPAKPKKQSRKR